MQFIYFNLSGENSFHAICISQKFVSSVTTIVFHHIHQSSCQAKCLNIYMLVESFPYK